MSVRAVSWAFDQPIIPASDKLVLVALADYCHEDQLGFAATKTLSRKTSLSHRTVERALNRLEKCGLIVDTNQRRGETRQIKVYRLLVKDRHHDAKDRQIDDLKDRHGDGQIRILTSNKRTTEQAFPLPDKFKGCGLDKDWADFIQHKKEMGAPMTKLAYARIIKKITPWKPETLRIAMNMAIENSWKTVFEPRKDRDYNARMRKIAERDRDDKLDREIEEVDKRRRGELRNVIDIFSKQQQRRKE